MIHRSDILARAGRFLGRVALPAAISALVLAPVAGGAVMPASPLLDQASRLTLFKALAEAGINETGASAVLISLQSVLGTGPASRQHSYREPYPQLPDVDAKAAPARKGCARVELTARPKAEPRRPVAISGVYCLADPTRWTWTARSLSVKAN